MVNSFGWARIVIFSDWTLDDGFVIAVQHNNDLISFYKHNSVLHKKNGNFVEAGEVLAVIGNTGESTDGIHLHFELWKDGIAINPTSFIENLKSVDTEALVSSK